MIYDIAIKICSNGFLVSYVNEEDEEGVPFTVAVLCADEDAVFAELRRYLGCGPKSIKDS